MEDACQESSKECYAEFNRFQKGIDGSYNMRIFEVDKGYYIGFRRVLGRAGQMTQATFSTPA